MKRLFNKLLATSLTIAIILCNTPVYAANEQYNSSITAEVESSYIVSIPKSIELDVNTIGVGTGNYTCYAYGDIEATSSVYIVPNSQFTMTKDSSDDSTIATVSQDKTEWEYNDMNSESPVVGNGSIYTNGLTAGNWNGVFYFNIEKTDRGSDVEAPVDETMEIELVDSEVVDAGTFTLGRSQVGAVQLSYKDEDVTYDAEYTSDNKNITVSDTGIINTDNATGGETATITVEYTPKESEQLDTASYSLRAAASEVSDSSTLSAYFTVQVIDIEFDKETLTLYQGDTATITANIVPDEVDGTVKWTLSGLDFGSEGNTITITVASDATPGNYVLSASYGSYTQSLNIKIVENETHSHLYSSEVTTQPTCTTSGVKTFTCSCGDSYTEEVAATGHSWEDDFTIDVEPTCTTVGSKSVHCANCSETKYVTEIPATGHTYVDGKCDCGDAEVTYVTLRSTAGEPSYNSGFLGSKTENSKYIKNDIISVTFYEDSSYAEGHYLSDTNCWDVSNAEDGSIIAWMGSNTLNGYRVYIAPTKENTKIQAHENCSYMFANLMNNSSERVTVSGIEKVDFSNTTNTDYFCSNSRFAEFTLPTDLKVIGRSAFKDSETYLKAITIPDGVVTIGDNAFEKCALLTSINIPSSVTTMGDNVFKDCTGLTSVTMSNNVTTIGSSAFYNCTNLLAMKIPNKTTSIGDTAFYNCTSLADVTVPSSVTSIGERAFVNTPWIATKQAENPLVIINNILVDATTVSGDIEIPSTIIDISAYAFDNCTGLTSVTVPKGITSIKNYTFRGCTNLTNIELPNSLTTIGVDAFGNCTGLTDITLPSSVTTIGSSAFYKCTSLVNVTVPESVTTIEGGVFNGCTSLTSAVLPSKITTLGSYLFKDCTSLTSITVPESVTTIEDNAFEKCTLLTSINIPSSVTTLGSSLFKDCTSLTSITVPTSVTTIKYNAFSGCTGLTDLVIPNSVTKIGSKAFYNVPHVTYSGSATGSPWGAASIN